MSGVVSIATAVVNTATNKFDITSVAAGSTIITVSDGINVTKVPVIVSANGTITIGKITKYIATFMAATDRTTANNDTTLGLVGKTAMSGDAAIATAIVNTATGKINITSVEAGLTIITVSDGTNVAKIPVGISANGTITIQKIIK